MGNPFAEMLARLSDGDDAKKPLGGKKLAEFRANFVHIPDLKPGDKVQWKNGFKDCRIPAEGEAVEVFQTIPIIPKERAASSSSLDEYDFSVVFKTGDDYVILPFDSRRFERVSE